jgi:hypothetical protein
MLNAIIATDLSEASLAALDSVCGCESGVFDKVTLLHVIDLDLYTALRSAGSRRRSAWNRGRRPRRSRTWQPRRMPILSS